MPTDLSSITNFENLLAYLADELDWPVEDYGLEDLTFEYDADELGLKDDEVEKLLDGSIRQLRPLPGGQPFGIFFVEFDQAKLSVIVLRRILNALVFKKRNSANPADRQRWDASDLIFVSAFGEVGDREIAFAHFHKDPDTTELPILRVLGWDGYDTPLKTKHVAEVLKNRLHWPEDVSDHEAWREQWRGAFRHRLGHVIKTSSSLAEVLAFFARKIRDAAATIMDHESEARGQLRKLHRAFQSALISDLSEKDFADTYAQTVTYGLLTAAFSRTEMSEGRYGTALTQEDITAMVPVTNPFLKEMLQEFLKVGGRKGGMDFDELGINEVVELLRGDETDLPAILLDFGNRKRGEDPVIHFYEHFLAAYNKKLRIQRGVFYTPQPVVSYIVRSVHELLQTEFGLKDGLADTATWGEMIQRHPDLQLPLLNDPNGDEKRLPESEPFVQILDPATGTATFLVEVIDVIHKHVVANWQQQGLTEAQQIAAWNKYVPRHLLPRLHGYELMMAPYAIAHMKIGLKLAETGYCFGVEERARIYLTNALEPKVNQPPQIGFKALALEAVAVNEIKWYKRFTVVIGNPPYSYMSANLTAAATTLIEPFRYVDGQRIREKSALSLERSLQDDFVKFFGLALRLRRDTGPAFILGFITNNSYMDSALHRGVRGEFMRLLDRLYLVNLFGDSIKDREENVFDIQQGVAVFLGLNRLDEGGSEVFVSNVHGTRVEKYATMQKLSWKTTELSKVYPMGPQRYFLRLETSGEYPSYQSLAEVFRLTSTCIKTLKDSLATGFELKDVHDNVNYFRDIRTSTDDIKTRFGVKDVVQWKMEPARCAVRRLDLKNFTKCYQARPFDYRYMFYHNAIVGSPRKEVMRNLFKAKNIALIANRKIRTGQCNHFWVSSRICVSEIISSADNSNCFPLYVLTDEGSLNLREESQPNFSATFLKYLCATLGTTPTDKNGLPCGITPEDIFHYIYAIFHSPGYRSRYAEFLKIDFPRLPLTGSLELFRNLARLGGKLTALHLLEAPSLDIPITTFIGGNHQVSKVGWTPDNCGTVWIDGRVSAKRFQSGTSGFCPVPEAIWNFHIGGYQVCEKWLKDRGPKKGQPGRTLTAEDIAHYHKIVIALSETIRLMAEIDEVIESHGGWPGAFAVQSKESDEEEK